MSLITTAQAADILAVRPATIRSMIRIGVLPAIRIISEYRIDEEDLHRFIVENKTSTLSADKSPTDPGTHETG